MSFNVQFVSRKPKIKYYQLYKFICFFPIYVSQTKTSVFYYIVLISYFFPTILLYVTHTVHFPQKHTELQLKNHSLKIPDIIYLATIWLKCYVYVLFNLSFFYSSSSHTRCSTLRRALMTQCC